MKLPNPLLLVFIALLSFGLSTSYAEVEENNVIIVLDASGSMWGKVDNVHKIAVAKNVVKDLVKDWHDNSKIGLIAYGHRKKGDCSDIETLIPIGTPNEELFRKTLSSMSAKGKTPLTDAVVLAAEELKYKENTATVILVSDGIETCKKDPCKIAKLLEQSGVDFTAHVIGFDLNKKDQEKIKCIADNTGGKFLAADSAKSLSDSMKKVVKAVKDNTGVKFYAVDTPGGKPLDIFKWRVYELNENDEPKEENLYRTLSAKPKFKLEAGRYYIKLEYGMVTHTEIVEVKNVINEKHEILIPMQGIVKLAALEKPKGKPLDVYMWTIYELDEDGEPQENSIRKVFHDTPSFTLLPGKYQVRVKYASVLHKEIIEVIAGTERELNIILPKQETIKLSAINKPNGKVLKIDAWHIYELDEVGEPKEKYSYYSYDNTPSFKVLPGKYQVKIRQAQLEHKEIIEVVSNKNNKYKILIPAQGKIRLSAINKPNGEPLDTDTWHIHELDDYGKPKDDDLTYNYRDDTPSFILPPGKYQVRVRQAKLVHKEIIEVKAYDDKKHKVLIPAQGSVRLKGVTKPGGEGLKIYSWIIFEADENGEAKGKYIYYTHTDMPKFTLMPGSYVATAKYGDIEKKQTFEITPYKLTKVEVVFK